MSEQRRPTVRAKFMCSGKQDNTVFFHTVYSEDIQSEDSRFTKATPWGELRMLVDNPAAAIQFEPGKQYYLDFTPAYDPTPPAPETDPEDVRD